MPTLQDRVKDALANFDEMTPDEVRRVLADVDAYFDAHDPIAQAMSTLSYSEEQALAAVAQEMEPTGGLLVSSKIADRVGITRSVIVNGLRKLESAGVIEARSLGMKGTHVTVLVPGLVERLRQLVA